MCDLIERKPFYAMKTVLFVGFKIVAHMMPDLPNVDFEVSFLS